MKHHNNEYRWQEAEIFLTQVEPKFITLVEHYCPCTLTPQQDYFSVLCNSIISQQLSTKAADTIFKRFCDVFPDGQIQPEIVLKMKNETIRNIGCSAAKTSYIKDLAEKTMDGLLLTMESDIVNSEFIIEQLTTVKGIGRWTAEMFLIFALNNPDILPLDDLGIKKALQKFWNLDNYPDKKTMENRTQLWKPYRTIASWYLWRSLENKS